MTPRQYRARCRQLGLDSLGLRPMHPIVRHVAIWLASTAIAVLLASAPLIDIKG